MYNNETTYHDKWSTEENKKYNKKIRKFTSRCSCASGVPDSWAKETYEFLMDLNKKFGIAYSTSTYDGYKLRIFKTLLSCVKAPFLFFCHIYYIPAKAFNAPSYIKSTYKTYPSRLMYYFKSLLHMHFTCYKQLFYMIYGKLYNKVMKPKIFLGQVKEKFGTLRVYYNAEPWVQNYVEEQIQELEVKLANKGAYYPPEDLYNWHSSSYDYSNTYKTKGKLVEVDGKKVRATDTICYGYRKVLKKYGYDLNQLNKLANKKRRENAKKSKASNNSKKGP